MGIDVRFGLLLSGIGRENEARWVESQSKVLKGDALSFSGAFDFAGVEVCCFDTLPLST